MVIYVFSATEVPSPQLPADAPPDSQVAASVEAAVQMAAAEDEVRLMHGPFVCKPLLFDGKCLVFKGIGRRSAGPGRRVIVIFTGAGSSACVTVSSGSVRFDDCVLVDSDDGESMTMSSVQARIKVLDQAMGRHPWQRDHDADRQHFEHAALQGCGALFNELQRICQWEKATSFVMENECMSAAHRLLQAAALQCGDSSSTRGDSLMTASAAAKARGMPPLLNVIQGHLQLSQCELLHRSPLQVSLQGSGGSCNLSDMQSISILVACGTFKLTLSHVRVCDPSSGGSSIKASNQSEITAEDCVLCSGVTCVTASDNSTVTLLRCAVYDAQRCAIVVRHNAAVDVSECVIGRAQCAIAAEGSASVCVKRTRMHDCSRACLWLQGCSRCMTQGCLLSSSTVGILAVGGSHVRETGSTLSRLLLPVWSCSHADTAALGVRGQLNRTRVEAVLPWRAAAAAAGERRTVCSAHAAVFHVGAGAWTVNGMVITVNARDEAGSFSAAAPQTSAITASSSPSESSAAAAAVVASFDRGNQHPAANPYGEDSTLTHAVHAICLPVKHTHHVACSVTVTRCNVAVLPGGVRALGAVRLAVARCSFDSCGIGVDHVMTARATQRSTEPPHSLLLPAAWVCMLDVRGCKFDASNSGSSACAVRCRWLCLIERLRPGTRPTAMGKAPQQQQPLLAAINIESSGITTLNPPSSTQPLDREPLTVPVMIDACSFTAAGIDFIGSVTEFPAAFACPVFAAFSEAATAASEWCASRARADSAWPAAVVSRCTFNNAPLGAGIVSQKVEAAVVVASAADAPAAAAPAAITTICVRAAADIALAVRDCVFAAHALTRHAVMRAVHVHDDK